jgi:hypothetical protein
MKKPWWVDRRGTRVAVAIVSATTTTLVAAVAGKTVRILRYSLTAGAAGAGTFVFKSSTAGNITGLRNIPNDGALGEVFTGGEECTEGEALEIVTTGTDLDGDVWYEIVSTGATV